MASREEYQGGLRPTYRGGQGGVPTYTAPQQLASYAGRTEPYPYPEDQTTADAGVAPDIYSDPAYLAFIRAQGGEESEAARQVASRTAAIQAALAATVPGYLTQGTRNVRQVGESAEQSGIYRSGQRLRGQAEAEAETAGQIAAAQAGAAQDIASLQSELAAKIAANRTAAAEKALALQRPR